ncbi:hypothetical protein B0H21DRAFT_888995 [Amylocystis lapponica]|nr:hypothetical protein B0H21DRAFT_888995 [Amylocystis lapponica]
MPRKSHRNTEEPRTSAAQEPNSSQPSLDSSQPRLSQLAHPDDREANRFAIEQDNRLLARQERKRDEEDQDWTPSQGDPASSQSYPSQRSNHAYAYDYAEDDGEHNSDAGNTVVMRDETDFYAEVKHEPVSRHPSMDDMQPDDKFDDQKEGYGLLQPNRLPKRANLNMDEFPKGLLNGYMLLLCHRARKGWSQHHPELNPILLLEKLYEIPTLDAEKAWKFSEIYGEILDKWSDEQAIPIEEIEEKAERSWVGLEEKVTANA